VTPAERRWITRDRTVARATPGRLSGIQGLVFSGAADLAGARPPPEETLMAGNVIELTDSNFDSEVLESQQPVLVDFTATWCGPCKALAPVVQKIADETAGKYKIGKLDIDDAPGVAQKYGIRGVPTLIVFKAGQKVHQHVGVTNKETLLKMLEG
jgi:thioredoxin 1